MEEADTAFHAGTVIEPTWRLIDPNVNPNLYTVGIEHEGQPQDIWPDEQYQASAALVREIAARWKIALDRDHVIMHHQIRASKICPGTVDMERLIAQASAETTPISQGAMTVKTTIKVNIRRRIPSTSSPIAAVIPAQTELKVVGFTKAGQSINGNSAWYETPSHDYVWSGATELQPPSAPQLG